MELATKEDYEVLKKKLDDMLLEVSMINTKLALRDVLYVSDVARIEGLSVTGIKKSPWLLPDFGVSQYPDGRVRWTADKVREWRERPILERISAYRKWAAERAEQYLEVKNG